MHDLASYNEQGQGVIVTVLLAVRCRLHRFLRDLPTEQEAHDALLFAAASLVILPLMPNHAIGPYNVLSPRRFWELVMAISGVGYVALRSFGSHFGLPLAGVVGGFISATATIGSLAQLNVGFSRQRTELGTSRS